MARAWLLCIALLAACGFGDNHGNRAVPQMCGDHVLDPGEGCDDGNTSDGDGCSAACAIETDSPACGNGVPEVGEDCDDGNTASGDGCSAACAVEQASACVLVPQSGCAAGDACDLADDTTGDTGCRDVTKPGTSDSRCTAATECDVGFTCVGDDTVSYCMRFCATESECPGTNSRCAFTLTSSSGTSLGVKVCSNSCSVLAQTGCPSGTGCLGIESSSGDFTDCREMDGKLDGEACVSSTECLPGSVCVNDGTAKTCREYCDTADVFCANNEICTEFSTPLVISGITLGFCE